MLLELERDEQRLLLELVHAHMDELSRDMTGPQTKAFSARCEEEKLIAERLLRHLHESVWDVTC